MTEEIRMAIRKRLASDIEDYTLGIKSLVKSWSYCVQRDNSITMRVECSDGSTDWLPIYKDYPSTYWLVRTKRLLKCSYNEIRHLGHTLPF